MSTQAAFYQTDPSLVSSTAPESLHLGNGFSPEFISLSLLEKGIQHQDMGMPYMQFLSNQTGSVQAMAQTCKAKSYPSVPSFPSFSFSSRGVAGHGTDFGIDNNRVSPLSDMSSNNSSSPLRWQKSDTDKRAKHLERNRAAASKSRQKQKRKTDQLQNRFQEVSRRRSSLDSEVKTLHSQLLFLKDQMLMHSRCEDEAIHLYLSRMVKQATNSTGEPDDRDARNYRQDSDSVSPSHDAIAGFHGYPNSHDHNPSELEFSHSSWQQF